MDKKQYIRFIGALIIVVVALSGSLSSAFATDTAPVSLYSLTTSSSPWSYGTQGMVSNDFLEAIRTGIIPSVREDIGNRGKFGIFEAVVPKLAKLSATPVEDRFKDGELVDKSLDWDTISKALSKDWLVKDWDWAISCLFNGCISNTEVNPTELYPKMDKFRKSVSGVAQKIGTIKDMKTLQKLSKALKNALIGKNSIANERYALYYITYLVVNEKLGLTK